MSYILELRKAVGHRPLISVGSSVLILDSQNRILLQHRTDSRTWGLIGGSSELGDSLEETATREALEEAGVVVHELEFLTVLSGRDYFYEYLNGDQIYNVGAIFMTRTWSGTPKADGLEGSEVRFFALDELPDSMGVFSNDALEILKKYLEKSA